MEQMEPITIGESIISALLNQFGMINLINEINCAIASIYCNVTDAHLKTAISLLQDASRKHDLSLVRVAISNIETAYHIAKNAIYSTRKKTTFLFFEKSVDNLNSIGKQKMSSYAIVLSGMIAILYHSLGDEDRFIQWRELALQNMDNYWYCFLIPSPENLYKLSHEYAYESYDSADHLGPDDVYISVKCYEYTDKGDRYLDNQRKNLISHFKNELDNCIVSFS